MSWQHCIGSLEVCVWMATQLDEDLQDVFVERDEIALLAVQWCHSWVIVFAYFGALMPAECKTPRSIGITRRFGWNLVHRLLPTFRYWHMSVEMFSWSATIPVLLPTHRWGDWGYFAWLLATLPKGHKFSLGHASSMLATCRCLSVPSERRLCVDKWIQPYFPTSR